MRSGKQQLAEDGYLLLDNVFGQEEINNLSGIIAGFLQVNEEEGSGETHAIRAVLRQIPTLKEAVLNKQMRSLISNYFGKDYFLVKSIYFNKPAASNWFVSYHQDLSVHAAQRSACEGFVNWTKKDDHIGVQPPADILGATFTIRIHLDDCDAGNGALRVIKGSHRGGVSKFDTGRDVPDEATCPVARGGIMIMRPLLLHASGKNTSGRNRRVLHLEFCNRELPATIGWAEKELIFTASE